VNIGGATVRRLLRESETLVFGLDAVGYASDLTSIEQVLQELGSAAGRRHQLLSVDLSDAEATAEAVRQAEPDPVLDLAAAGLAAAPQHPGGAGAWSSRNRLKTSGTQPG
jgi:dTDP-glucose 4,6-dehydratase